MKFETPLDRYQRLPPRQRYVRSVIGVAVLFPLGVVALALMDVHIGLIAVIAGMWLTVGAVQVATTYREWQSEFKGAPPSGNQSDNVEALVVPRILMILETLGLLTLSGAVYLYKVSGEINWLLGIIGAIFVAPAIGYVLRWAFRRVMRA